MEPLRGEGKARERSLDGEAGSGRGAPHGRLRGARGVALTRVHKTTILSLILKLDAGCERLHNRLVRELRVNRIECDEMHSFVHTREHNLEGGEPREWGASWLWLGIASTAKLIISYRVAETRDERCATRTPD